MQKLGLESHDIDEFETFMTYLIENEESRDRIFEDPARMLPNIRLKLSAEDLGILKQIGLFRILRNEKGFNEKLVLCSSSGY